MCTANTCTVPMMRIRTSGITNLRRCLFPQIAHYLVNNTKQLANYGFKAGVNDRHHDDEIIVVTRHKGYG